MTVDCHFPERSWLMTDFPPVAVDDCVLVLTHLQNEFWHPDGRGYHFTQEKLPHPDTLERVNRLVAACREREIPLIFHNETCRPGHPELRLRRGGYVRGTGRLLRLPEGNMVVRGEWGASVLDSLKPDPSRDEFVVDNAKVDPFTCSEFEPLLRNLDRHLLILVGLAVNFGIEETARSGNERDYGIVVVRDCTDRLLGDYTEATFDELLPYFGRVASSDELIKEIQEAEVGSASGPAVG